MWSSLRDSQTSQRSPSHRSTTDAQTLNDQLSHALNSRVIIEQAKGMVSQATSCNMDAAFDKLRTYARSHNARLTDVAEAVVSGRTDPNLLDHPGAP
jgi:AmiR/NasT family two-component response regulator